MTSLQELANAQPPLVPTGRALALLCVTVIGLSLSYVAVGLRVWCRAIWLSNVWGLDDTLAVLGLLTYTVASAFAILCAYYGLGTPDAQLDPVQAYATRVLEYNLWWEVSYLISAALVKTSIGVASLRIAFQRRYRYTIYASLALSNAACIGGVIWELAACRPLAARWNHEAGTCDAPGLAAISYAITTVTVITDAACALVPVLILRNVTMRPRMKYSLMVVLALGSTAAFASVARFPFVPYFKVQENFLYENVWIPLLSMIECAVGLVTGSLPGIAKMFHFFNPPSIPPQQRGPEAWAAVNTVGGSPLSEMSFPAQCDSAEPAVERPSPTKSLPRRSVRGVWSVISIT